MPECSLFLVSCSITEVAATLSLLPNLAFVDIGFETLEGPLDSTCALSAAQTLESLNLMGNALSGSIPACIAQLPALAELHLDFNQLTGSIPPVLPSASPLVYFTAAYQVQHMHVWQAGRKHQRPLCPTTAGGDARSPEAVSFAGAAGLPERPVLHHAALLWHKLEKLLLCNCPKSPGRCHKI
jgi:hypothetical protein